MKKLVLIKIGGSLITDKTKPLTVRDDMMLTAALGIQQAVEKNPEHAFIVANGAGSFGHYLASQEEGSNPEDRIHAIHESVVLLNKIFVAVLIDKGLPAVSIIPAEIISAKDGVFKDISIDDIEDNLSINTIPVLFGDIVADGSSSGMIFSTESLFEILAQRLHDEYEITMIYVGETEGVLDKDGGVTPEISTAELKDVGAAIQAPKGYDVTGGMLHKVESALRMTEIAKAVYIISGKDPQNITTALSGGRIGTRIVR